MKKIIYLLFYVILLNLAVFAQVPLPRESQRQEIAQIIGDTRVAIVYHRPNVKGRQIWGCETKDVIPIANAIYPCVVPNGQVWRTGANENTTFEFSHDVTINGQPLPAGKYGFHTIPGKDSWILIFSKVNDAWGSFSYNSKNDALRVTVKPVKAEFQETLLYDFQKVTADSGEILIRWEKLAIPFTVGIGDIFGRNLTQIREAIASRKPDDVRPLAQGAGYIYTFRLKDNYEEALGWLETSIKVRETFGNLQTKARILAEMGRKSEAIAIGEKALQIGKAATPPANTLEFEVLMGKWKGKK